MAPPGSDSKNMEISTTMREEFERPQSAKRGQEDKPVRKSYQSLACNRRAQTTPRQQQQLCSFLTCLHLMILCFRFIPTVDGFYIDEKQSPKRHEWSYDQREWPKLFSSCSMKAQSPIDIQAKNVIQSNHLRLYFYNYNRQYKFKLQNAHHTVKMNPLGFAYQAEAGLGDDSAGARHQPKDVNSSLSLNDMITADEYVQLAPSTAGSPGQQQQQQPRDQHAKLTANSSKSSAPNSDNNNNNVNPNDILSEDDIEQSRLPYEGAPTIKLDWLDDGNNEYKLRDVHFHWGERRDNGSEHAIDGRRAAMEMHLVHIKHGLDKSKIGFTSDSVAVIAILIESHRKSNADFNPIVNVLSRINMTDEPEEIEYKSINDLLPSNLNSFYTYSGSLTTPPCYQVVNWIVMTERLNMNAKQIEMFRNLYAPLEDGAEHRELDTTTTTTTTTTSELSASDHHKAQLMVPNIRSLQALNNRTILASFTRWPVSGSALGGATTGLHLNHISLCHYALLLATSISINLRLHSTHPRLVLD